MPTPHDHLPDTLLDGGRYDMAIEMGSELKPTIEVRRMIALLNELASQLDGMNKSGLFRWRSELCRDAAKLLARPSPSPDMGEIEGLVTDDHRWAERLADVCSRLDLDGIRFTIEQAIVGARELERRKAASELTRLAGERDAFEQMFRATVKNGASDTMVANMERILAAESRVTDLTGEVERLRAVIAPHACKCEKCERSEEDQDDSCRFRSALAAQKGERPDADR